MGKTVDDDEIELIEIDLDWHAPSPAPSAATSSEPARPIWRRALAFDPRWLILVAVVVYVGWFLTSNGGDDEAAPPSPSTAPTSASTTPPAETVTTEDDRAALGGDPSLDLAAAIETLVAADYDTSYLEMQVNPNGVDVFAVIKDFDTVPGGFRFAYIGVDGRPVVIDTEAGELRSLVTEAPLEGDAGFVDGTGFAVLPDRDGILGLDRSRPDQAWRVGADMSVVRRHTGELFGVRETDAGVEYGLVDDPDGWETLPAGAEFWIEPSVGVFLVPASGGVFELTPDGVESVTPFEMLTTSGTRWIERRRIEGPNEYWVVDRSGEEWLIDRDRIEVGGDLSISPDGAWVFASDGLVDSDFPAFWGVETGEIIEVESRADRSTPVWAPDSSFVAELDATRDCIWINFLTGNNGCIVLDQLNVPALDASSLVVY